MSNPLAADPRSSDGQHAAPASQVVQRLIEQIVDGESVNWDALGAIPVDPAVNAQLQFLQLLEGLGVAAKEDASSIPDVLPASDIVSSEQRELRTWGRYRLDDLLGEGSFGRVYRGWDPELQMPVAIKILHPPTGANTSSDELLPEAQALGQVRHPNVVRVLCMETHQGRRGLCMEFIQGETLDQFVRGHGPLGHREVTNIGEDLCGGLAAIHAAGFLHCDIKARNVMRERAGRIILMDLGARGLVANDHVAGAARNLGTPYYMAPELFANGRATKGSDVYSLGVLLFYLLTNRYPVEGSSIAALREAHTLGRRLLVGDVRPEVPLSVARAIDRACATAPNLRFQSAAEFQSALQGPTTPGSLLNRVARSSVALLVLLASLIGMGLLSARAFNATLERSSFASESLVDLLGLGLRASVLPSVFFAFALLILGLGAALRALLLRSRRGAAIDTWFRARLNKAGCADPTIVATAVLALSVTALVGSWWHYAPLLEAFSSRVSTAPAETLALLSPASLPYQMEYRTTLIRLVIALAGGWYLVAKLCAERAVRLHPGVKLGAIATMILLIGTLQLPYRLIFDSGAPLYLWKQQECYAIGQRGDEFLLFCPGFAPPRNRIVSRTAADLVSVGRIENIFTPFSARGGPPPRSPLR